MIDFILENGFKSLIFWVVGVLAGGVFVLATGVDFGSAFPTPPANKFQAVFLSNNQVYFGRLQDLDTNYVTLSDVYYLRTASDLENQKDSGTGLNLIKLGGELHGPEDTIYIPKSSILFWENLKDSSRVVQSIIGSKTN